MSIDPFWSNVVLLLHLEGANGSVTITDSSISARSAISNNSSLSTAQQKFGTSSWASAASNGYWLYTDNADWDLGAGQFTIEAWVRPSAAMLGSGVRFMASQWRPGSVTNSSWAVQFNGAAPGFFEFGYTTSGSTPTYISGAYLPPDNTWTHIAVDRDASNVIRIYADGVVIASGTAAVTIFNSTRDMSIGNASGTLTNGFIGNIDEVRITKGVARYAGAFTPPTAAFPESDHFSTLLGRGLVRETIGSSEGEVFLRGVVRESVVTPAAAGPTSIMLWGLVREAILPSFTGPPPDLDVYGIAREVTLDDGTPALVVGGMSRETILDAGSGIPTLDVGGIAREVIMWRIGEEGRLVVAGLAREVVLVPGTPKPKQYAVPVSLGWPG